MAFYSTQDYLAAEARKNRNQIRGRAPPGTVHPPEHERARMQMMLDSIPETQPGPNAFAIQAEMAERARYEDNTGLQDVQQQRVGGPQPSGTGYEPRTIQIEKEPEGAPKRSMKERLATSAAFQQELQRRQAAPPTDVHPAFRSRSVSNPLILPPTRDSDCTQITDFIKAAAAAENSPKLQLKATPNIDTQPTFRARIEERNEQDEYELSGRQEERVPVFHPTPKMPAAKDFAPAQRPAAALGSYQQEEGNSKLPIKTPKKSFFSKLKLSANSRTSHPSVGGLIDDPANQADEKLPVKAQAVLGDSPRKAKGRVSLGASPTKLPRSPSKRKNFFSRKNADATSDTQRPHTSLSENQRPPNTPSTVVSDGPHTAISDPSHYSYQERQAHLKNRLNEKRESVKEVQKTFPLGRSQSVNLRYFDGGVPPTPPAKNTPPHEKAAKEAKEINDMHEAMKLPPRQRERTPDTTTDGAILSTTDRISPTKFGNYGYRDAPTLVTKPSMYSMHASVVPDLMEATTLEEMNARVGALDLEGFSTPAENNAAIRRSRIAEAVYSPSVYSAEWGARSPAMALGATPILTGVELRASNTPSAHTKDSSSNGTIPIFYPDLATDPSVKIVQQSTPNKKQTSLSKTATTSSPVRGRTHLSPSLAVHNRTHSRDHLPDTEDSGNSNEQSLFAHHIEHDRRQRHAGLVQSPSTFSHASAMPSPLQYLPATTYTPPQKMKIGKGKERAAGSQADRVQNTSAVVEDDELHEMGGMGEEKVVRTSGLGIETGDVGVGTPSRAAKRKSEGFANKGWMSGSNYNPRASPGSPIAAALASGSVSTDPEKGITAAVPNSSSLSTSDVQVMMEMLRRLETRSNDVNSLRDEMREEFKASSARLDQRLSAMESQHRDLGPMTPSTTEENRAKVEDWQTSTAAAREAGIRVPTDVAMEFYRSAQPVAEEQDTTAAAAAGAQEEGVGEDGTDAETIKKLKEENRKLVQLMGGFAEKLQWLEEKMRKDGSSSG